MASLPDATAFGPRPVPRPERAVATISPGAAGAVGNAIAGLGAETAQIGFEIIDREATAAAKERDALVSEQIRSLLYDPQSGYMNLEGGSAVQGRESILKRLDDLKSSAMKDLSRPAQKKLNDALTNRIESAKQSIDTHASGARKVWIDGASNARIESAYQDSLIDPAKTQLHLNTIIGEIQGQAVRDGWAPEKTSLEIQKATSKVYNDQILRVASSDPVTAMQLLRDKQDEMLPSDVVNLEARLQPAVKEYIGWQKGREIFQNVSAPAMASFKALEEAVGFPLKVNSGYRDPEHNARVGGAKNSQHTHGNAFDVDVSNMSIEQRQELIRQARKAGFSGIGVYDNALHFDVGGDRAWGPSYGRESLPEWASEAVRSPIGDRPSAWDQVLAEDDPVIRKSMADSLELHQSVQAGEIKAERDAARDAAFQMIEAGGNIMDLSLDQRQSLGEQAMSALIEYQNKKARKQPIETDPETYLMLRTMQAENPTGFRETDLVQYVSKLSETDWQQFVDAQNKPMDTVKAVAASTLMTTAKRHMQAAGIDTNPKEGSAGAKKVSAIQTQLLQWQDAYIKEKGQTPTQIEIDRQVARMMTPVTINPPGIWNEQAVRAFETAGLDLEAGDLAKSDITITTSAGDTTIPSAVINEQIIALQEDGEPVTAQALVSRIMALMERAGIQ